MTRSVLESSLALASSRWRERLARHDRGVLLGFLLSLVPILPVPLVGLGLGLFHIKAHRDGRLSDFDHALARRGVFTALATCALGLLLAAVVIGAIRELDPAAAFAHLPTLLSSALRWLLNLRGNALGGTTV
ncbi:MAG: hypothetical protein U1F25_18710 [Rubrivivax sp.]